ncbi:very short patch repair endonuclease [Oricola indica]|uniref:very short patch repair endonuclease n=1 Tax=Oricola indica TaxID=2872591 RepID=UPI001CBD6E32|nr:DNA mismatch endonuclease Vsr [Oricola indica]
MADRISKAHRSWNMSRIRGKDTKPEKLLRSALHRAGFRFRLHSGNLPGKPDIVLPKYRTVIFVHGCYWHRHSGCRHATTPKSNIDFWNGKFAATVERDLRNVADLEAAGWRVLIVWECEIEADLPRKVAEIKAFLGT